MDNEYVAGMEQLYRFYLILAGVPGVARVNKVTISQKTL